MSSSIPTPKSGSSWYYALLHTPPEFRETFSVIYGFYALITQAGNKEAVVAHAKLNWWANEIQNTAEKPQHPLTLALKQIIEKYQIDIGWFLSFIHAVKKTAEPFYFEDEADFLHHCQERASIYQIIAHLQDKTLSNRFGQNVGIFLTSSHFIRYAGKYLKQHKMIIPRTTLAAYQLDADTLFTPSVDKYKWQQVMQQQVLQAKQYYNFALHAIETAQPKNQLNLLILLKLNLQLLDEIEKENFDLLEKSYHLTPIRKWWIAQKLSFGVKLKPI